MTPIAELKEWAEKTLELHRLHCDLAAKWGTSDSLAEADLLSILDDHEKVNAEVEEFQEQYAQLESRCYDNGFPTGGSVFSELEKAEAELEKVKVELSHAKEVAEGAGYRLQKAEAALLGTQVVSAKNGAVIVEQMAELARYAPLIDAAKKARKSTLTDDRVFWGVDEDAILRAALKCKEGK